MSQEKLQDEEIKESVSKQTDIQLLLKESRDIMKEKQNASEKIREFKQQLRKANRDQQQAQFSKEKAATETPALAHNSSMNSQSVSNVLGKRKDRDNETFDSNYEVETIRETPSKRQKYTRDVHEEVIPSQSVATQDQSHQKLSSIVVSSALKKKESHEGDTKQKNKEPSESVIKLKGDTNISFDDKKAMRSQKFQHNVNKINQLQDEDNQKPLSKQVSIDNQSPQMKVVEGRKDEQIKRTRNLFSNMMKHLEKAKTRLESEKDILGKQEQVVQKVSEKLMKDSSQIQEIQISVIEDRLNQEIDRKRDLERKLIQITEEVKNMKHLEQLRRLANFIKTETKPQIFWMPAKHNEKTFACFQKSKQSIDNEIEEYKKQSDLKLVERLKQYDEIVQQLNEKRQQNGLLLELSQSREQKDYIREEKIIANQSDFKDVVNEKEGVNKDNLDDFDVDEDEDLINDIYALN